VADEPKNDRGPFDVPTIRLLAALMSRHDLSEIDLRDGDQRVRLLRGGQVVTAVSAPAIHASAPSATALSSADPAPAAEKPVRSLIEIKSEGIGIFFTRPKPEADPFVHVGSRVQPDSVVGLIEAMKLYSDIQAGCTGVIAEILVNDEQPVEYDQVLFRVDPMG
jgi:acetyl-CoA carboxylase biotin carboxyl carrier protein